MNLTINENTPRLKNGRFTKTVNNLPSATRMSIEDAVAKFSSAFKMCDLNEALELASIADKASARKTWKYTQYRGGEIIFFSEKTQDRVYPERECFNYTKKEIVEAFQSMLEHNPKDNPEDLHLIIGDGLDGSDEPFNKYQTDYQPEVAYWCVRLDVNGIDSDFDS